MKHKKQKQQKSLKTQRKHRAFDVLGDIALVRFPKQFKEKDKKRFAKNLMKRQKSIKTVLEKVGKIKGRLRKLTTKYVLGEKTKEVLYKENNCVFRFNIDTCYFSPRLSNERKEIANKIKKNQEVLVMFAGVAPYSIVIAKNSNAKKIYSNEINKIANKYARLNINLNNLKNKIEFLDGDIKKISSTLKRQKKKFDVIIMPRPQLKNTYLKQAFSLSRKGTRIFYYDFCKDNKKSKNDIINKIKSETKKYKKNIKILKIKKAGEIAPYQIRVRVDFRVLS